MLCKDDTATGEKGNWNLSVTAGQTAGFLSSAGVPSQSRQNFEKADLINRTYLYVLQIT